MKKIIILIVVQLTIFLTGCAKSDNTKSELKPKTNDILYESVISVQGMSKKLTIYQDGKIMYKNNLPGNSISPETKTIPKEVTSNIVNMIEKSNILSKDIIMDDDSMTLCESNSSWLISVGDKSKNFSLPCGEVSAESKITLDILNNLDYEIYKIIDIYLK